jgi:hypothetical protein
MHLFVLFDSTLDRNTLNIYIYTFCSIQLENIFQFHPFLNTFYHGTRDDGTTDVILKQKF